MLRSDRMLARPARRLPGQAAQVQGALPRCAPFEIEDERRHYLEADFSALLFRIDVAGKRVPAARRIEFEIVRLAEQKRKLRRVVIAQGLGGCVERDTGIALAAAIGAGRNAANAADVNLASVPGHGPEIDADVTGKAAFGRLDQHAQVRMGPFNLSPGQFLEHFVGPDGVQQRFGARPGGITVQNLDLDAHLPPPAFAFPYTRGARGKLPAPRQSRKNSW